MTRPPHPTKSEEVLKHSGKAIAESLTLLRCVLRTHLVNRSITLSSLTLLSFSFSLIFFREMDAEQEDRYATDDWTVCEGSRICILKKPWHVIALVLNILMPGSGTLLSAATCLHLRNHTGPVNGEQVLCLGSVVCDGLLQFFLSPILIGWVWSVLFGI